MMARGKKKESALTPEEKLAQALVPVEEQPYKVPRNWCWARIGAISDFERGITFPASAKENEPTEENIPCLRTANVQENLEIDDLIYVNQSFMKGNEAKLVRENDIIMSSANSRELVGKASFVTHVPFPMTFGGFVLNIRARGISSKYLFYFLRQEFLAGKFMGESTQTTNIANINTTTLGGYELPLPPLAEQQRIVDRIEYLFDKLDDAKEKAQSVLDSFETRKAAILHKAFTGELTAKWRAEHGVALDSIEKVPLGELADIISSKRIYKEEYVETGVPFFRSSEVVELHDYGMTIPEFFISRQRYEEIKKQYGVPREGDLLVTSVGTIGKTWIVDGREFYYKDGNLTQVMQCESLDMKYLQYFIKSEIFKQQVNDTVAGSAYNALTIVKFKKILIPLVGLAEQTEIVRILDNLFAKEHQAKEAAEAVLEKIDLLKKSILARAFRGELGTNDPAEESALELLKRVLN